MDQPSHHDTFGDLRRMADDLYKRGQDATGADQLTFIEAAARLGELIPDAPDAPCALTGRRAEGYARTANGLRFSHGREDERPTAFERYLSGERVTVPVKRLNGQLVAILASATDAGVWDPSGQTRGGEALVARFGLRHGSSLVFDYVTDGRAVVDHAKDGA